MRPMVTTLHTGQLLGVARILQRTARPFEGTVKLIFPAGKKNYPAASPHDQRRAFWRIRNPLRSLVST